jgi:hypothetical protein
MSGARRPEIAGRWAVFVVGVTVLVAIAGCGTGGHDSRSGTPPSTTTADPMPTTESEATTATTTTTVETGVETVTAALRDLAGRYDEAVEGILTDPRVAGDHAHPAVRDYLALFVPDSEFATGALDSWAQQGADGRFYRPGPRGRMSESTVSDVDVDETTKTTTFLLCSLTSVEIVDAAGTTVSAEGGQTAATAVAELIDDEWLLRELSETSSEGCDPPAEDPETS